jgi:fermentation-respiration switch protein FrsA (DUF1100 family)
MKRRIAELGGLIFCGCLSCGTVESVILKPSPQIRRLPTDFGYSYESKMIPTPNGNSISIWHVAAQGERKGVIVVIPGNEGNKSGYVLSLPIFADNGWDVVLFDFTGFGESPGNPTLAGLVDSADGAIDYAKSQSDVVVAYAVSLGTSVLARVAADRDLTACIFESTMVLREAPSLLLDFFGLGSPLGGLTDALVTLDTPDDYDTKRWIQQVKAPKLFIHSPDDTATPFAGAMEVFKLAPQPKHMFVSQGEHALQVFLDPGLYRNVVNGWLDGIVKRNPVEIEQYKQYLEEETQAGFAALGLPPPPPGLFAQP